MFFFFKQKTAYEMRISDWSSDVCSSDLLRRHDNTLAQIRIRAHRERHAARIGWQARGSTSNQQCSSGNDGDGPDRVLVDQIGRASCRERVCQYVESSGVAVALNIK